MNIIISPSRTVRFCGNLSYLFLITLLLLLIPSHAFCRKDIGTPKVLKEWIPWVLYNHEDKTCTLRSDDISKSYCAWPSQLVLEINDNGAVFHQQWNIETESLVPLPGSLKLWPESVMDIKRPLIVLDHNGTPSVRLQPGRHFLSGKLSWNPLPDSIILPSATGLIKLANKVTQTDRPFIDQKGTLWLKKHEKKTTEEVNQASAQVFRKIQDTLPLQEEVHIILTVSGAPREITLGLMVNKGFLPQKITTLLPARLDNKGRLVVQARPGQWLIVMVIRTTNSRSPEQLTIGDIDGLWPEDEIWSFEAMPKLRRVHIENALSIDPSRTGLPAEWLNLPAYFMGKKDTMQIKEKERGNLPTTPNRLTLSRTLWLDQAGDGLTAFDVISGNMVKGWRLNVVRQQHLGKVDIDGKSQLITKLSDSDTVGVEVRKGRISLTADSRIEQPVRTMLLSFPAAGWDHSFQHLSATLNLPPGWKLLTSSGVDKVSTWVTRWTLLDIFLVLITCLATGKLFGWRCGLLSLVALVLMYHQLEAPRYLWLPLLAFIAIGRMIPSEKSKYLIGIPIGVILLLLVLQSVPFMVREVRVGIFPQLEFGPYYTLTTNTKNVDAASMHLGGKKQSERFAPSLATKMYSLQSMAPSEKSAYLKQTDKELQYDPRAMIQTGPGLPLWHWRTIPLTWNGPVSPTQKVYLILLPPWLNCTLAFLRVGLLGLLFFVFFKNSLFLLPKKDISRVLARGRYLAVFPLIALLAIHPTGARAQIPDSKILQELQNRLVSPPVCGNECASLNNCLLINKNGKLYVKLTVAAATDTAVPLPGDRGVFSTILLDNIPAEAVQDDNGTLLIKVSSGIHHLLLEKDLGDLDDFSLTFPLLPHRVQTDLSGWTVTGIHPNATMEKQISFSKIDRKQDERLDETRPRSETNDVLLPQFFQIKRTLHFGLKWTVDTRVIRRTQGNVISAQVPLIPGEMPTTSNLSISKNKVQVNLGPQDETFSWHSVLSQGNAHTLSAPKTTEWVEMWYLDISPIWHMTFSGIPEVSRTNTAGVRLPEYHPYPGESMTMSITRPPGVPGPTMTFDSSRLNIRPGMRSTDCTLLLSLLASRGTEHTITLPVGMEVLKVSINNKEHQLQPNANRLTLPIQPGKQTIDISWRNKKGIATRTYAPHIDLGLPSVNATIHMDIPLSRWILFTQGPRIGPAVLFWGEILIIIILAFLLGRMRFSPLSSWQWLLLGIGLSQVDIIYGAIVVGWLFLLSLRKEKISALSSDVTFNFLQISLVIITLFACFSLLYAVQKGLLGYPDMQIGGNGSFGHSLTWYQDRNLPALPRPLVLSLPLFVYRCLMLIWALWLAFSLIKWLGWGWTCFAEGGLWRKKAHHIGDQQEPARETVRPTASHATSKQQVIKSKEPDAATDAETPKSRIKSWYLRLRKTNGHKTKTEKNK